MAFGGTATIAGIEPGNEGRDIPNETGASGRNRCRGTSGNRSNNRGGTWDGDNDR